MTGFPPGSPRPWKISRWLSKRIPRRKTSRRSDSTLKGDTLLGLYQGVTLPDRGLDYSALPDRIVLYRLPILDMCGSREEVVREVRITVEHELGHYFGLEEDDLPP